MTSTDDALGEALGKLYVADNFPPEAKARMLELVNNLKEALADSIKSRDWMDDATKQEALKKLAAFHGQDRLPGQMARLLAAQDRSRPVRAERDARGHLRNRIAS